MSRRVRALRHLAASSSASQFGRPSARRFAVAMVTAAQQHHAPSLNPTSGILTAAVENDDARADEFCALAENQAGLNGFDDGEQAKPIINRLGNPTVSPGNVA